MLSMLKILEYIGDKIFDQIIDGSIDTLMEEATNQKLLQEYQKIKVEIKENLLSKYINESYYEYIQKLLNETRILDIIFKFSYIFCELSKAERENYINSYIDDFFNGRKIDRTDVSIVKGIFLQQYNYYFNIINRPDDKSRKMINQLVLQIANSRSEQKILMESLKCELKDIAVTLEKIIEMFSSYRFDDLEKLYKIEEIDQKEPFVITETHPLQPTNFFRGRDAKLNEIKDKLSGTAKLLLLNGMGGIGKTEMCRKLFHEAINRKLPEVCNVGWLTYSGSLEQTFFRQFIVIKNPADQPSEYLLQSAKYINAQGGGLLLFIDNANEITEKEVAWILMLECKVILTSRRRSVERLQALEIGKLAVEDCRILYRKHLDMHPFDPASDSNYGIDYTEDASPDENLDAIITMADRHTLAIELLAKAQRAALRSIEQFRRILDEQNFSLASISEKITYIHNPENGDWDKSEQIFIEQFSKVLDISEIKGEKLRLLRLFSLLMPEPVLTDDVRSWLAIDDFESVNALISHGWLFSGIIGSKDKGKLGLAMHPLVSSVIRYKAMPDEKMAEPLITGLTEALTLPDEEVFIRKLLYVKHAVSVIDAIKGTGNKYPDLINHASNILLRFSDYGKAEAILLKVKAVLDGNNPIIATTHNNLGMAYERQGKYDSALDEYEKALDIFIKTIGKEHRDTATAYNNKASVYAALGKYSEALNLFHIAADIRESVLGNNHPITQSTYNNMAVVYTTLGDFDHALELLFGVLESSKERLGSRHPYVAITYSNIAEALCSKGDYNGAMDWDLQAVAIMEEVLGKENPDTGNAYNSLAMIYANKGDYSLAMEYYEKALTIYRKTFGESHYDSAMVCANIAQLYNLKGDYPKALEMAEKSLGIIEGIFGTEHLNMAILYSNLAGILSNMGEYRKAERYYQRALSIRKKVFGDNHPDSAAIYHALACICNKRGQDNDALMLFLKAFCTRSSMLGADHCSTLETLGCIKFIYKNTLPHDLVFEEWLNVKLQNNSRISEDTP